MVKHMRIKTSMDFQRGASMIEVLVTIVILAFGLLGLMGLQSRLQVSEMEAFQRAQALVLLEDMANRIAANRNFAASYITGTTASAALGTGHTCTTTSASTRQAQDACEWSETLKGAAEISGGSKVGAFMGGRGCVEDLGAGQYMITVAWQGLGPVSAPPAGVACGQGLYNGPTGSLCTGDLCRRALTTVVRVAVLS
jgi:type IV pilus assembly protein PilV